MKKPPRSNTIQKARQERNRLALRWAIAGLSGAFGVFLGGLVYYWIQEMHPPPYRPANVATNTEGLAAWWYEFAQRWQLVLASSTSGTFGVLLATLSFLEKRKEAATYAFGVGVSVIVINGVALAWDGGFPAWEVTLPAFICSLTMNWLLGVFSPPDAEDPWVRKYLPNAMPASPGFDQDKKGTWSLSLDSTQEEFADDTMALHYLPDTLPYRCIYESIGVVLAFLLLHFLLPADFPQRTPLLGAGAAVCVVLNWSWFKRRVRRRLAKACTEQFGLSFPIQEVWEMNDAGLTHRWNEVETKLAWSDLHSLKELKSGFHMGFHEVGVAFLPYRAFTETMERRRWGARLRLHLVKKAGS